MSVFQVVLLIVAVVFVIPAMIRFVIAIGDGYADANQRREQERFEAEQAAHARAWPSKANRRFVRKHGGA